MKKVETAKTAYKQILAYKLINTKAHTKSQRSSSLALKCTFPRAVWDEMIQMIQGSAINVNLEKFPIE